MSKQRTWISTELSVLEGEALRLLRTPAAMRALEEVATRWIAHVNPDETTRGLFEGEFRQAAFAAALRAVNCDPIHPRIHALGRFEHALDGETIPGSNYGHGNPDCIYRLMPVEPGSTYRLSGRFPGKRPVASEVSLVDGNQVFLGNISTRDLIVDKSGGFSVTLSPEPNRGAGNYLKNVPGAYSLCVRDIIGDAQAECPALLTIERLGPGAQEGKVRGEEHSKEAFPPLLRQLVDEVIAFENRILRPMPVNTFSSPTVRSGDALLPSQAFSMGRFVLDEETAVVFTVTLASASHFILPATNLWGGLGRFLTHVGALNNFSAAPDTDGRFTFVLSLADPGIANWIDPDGAREGVVVARWIDFARNNEVPVPELSARVIRFSQVSSVLPDGVQRCDGDARAVQRAAHGRNYLAVKG